jgi:two-component system sensor histidine kinase HydH
MNIKAILRYLPVLSIVLLALLMLVIVILWTMRNISSLNARMEEFAIRQGMSVIRTLEAGTRTGFLEGDWGIENLQMLIEQAAKDPDVAWVGLINSNGVILSHSEPAQIGLKLMMGKDLETVRTVLRTGEPLSYKRKLEDGPEIFEIWKPFTPFPDQIAEARIVARHTRFGKDLLDIFEKPSHKQALFLGLKMERFRQIRRQEVMYAIFMGGVIFIIGSAGVYFIFVVQNAVLVRRTLDEMRAYTRNVLESMPNGLITVDQKLNIATYNPAALAILRIGKQEIEQGPISEILPLEREINRVLQGADTVHEKEVKLSDDPKNKTVVGLSVSPLREPDYQTPRGAVIIVRDLTIIRELEQKVVVNEKFAALGRLSAGVAHEIRNPLNSIRGFIQYFQRKLPMEEEDYNYTELMLTEVDRLNRVISKLLAYSKPREPRLGVRSVDETLDHCIRVVQREATESGIEIVRKTDGCDEPPLALMDTDQITQVFLNLMINAIEASPRGGKVTVGYHCEDNSRVHITVQDQGDGIPLENMDKLFDPFFTTKRKGTGLGLAIVKSIIEGHGGEIEIDSEPEEGSKFVISLSLYNKDLYGNSSGDKPRGAIPEADWESAKRGPEN